jgi:putative peptide zinc metalloprotease protein
MSDASLTSSATRPLRLRMRPDITYDQQTYQGRTYWIVKDPVVLKYFRFEEEEFAILLMLDGCSSPDQIQRRFNRRFSPQKISLRELLHFVGSLFRGNLVISDSPGQGDQLLRRGTENKKRRRTAALSNVLAIQLKGIDPDRILTNLNRIFGWLFSKFAVAAAALLALSAMMLVLINWELFSNRLPTFQEFFAAKNWIWLALTLGCTKILHEFGHGIACRRFGGRCHEMGIMFLVLTPCLYCNVSDSWTLANKWHRIAIGAAGMYFEFILASICVFVWSFTEPGIVNHLALNIIVVSSVSTLAFNANPLMRYDGYYILSDLSEIPNLRQKASKLLNQFASTFILGIPHADDPFLPSRRKWLFIVYSIAAGLYRWFVTFSIFWFLYSVLEPYGLKIIGQLIAMMALYGLIVHPIISFAKFLTVPGRIDQVNRTRIMISSATIVAVLAMILVIPVPHYITCPFHVQPMDATQVYVSVPGFARRIECAHNQMVRQGQTIVQLENDRITDEIARLQKDLEIAQDRYNTVRSQAIRNPDAEAEFDVARSQLESAITLLDQRREDLQRLTLEAPVSGTLIAPDWNAKSEDDNGELIQWYGWPLEHRNLNAYLENGTIVAQIVPDPGKFEAILAIDQSDLEFVDVHQAVELWIRQLPVEKYSAEIRHISPIEMESVPKPLSKKAGGDLMTVTGANGREKPHSTTYQVSVPFQDNSGLLVSGSTGVAKIHAGYRPLGSRLWRLACKTFRFEL